MAVAKLNDLTVTATTSRSVDHVEYGDGLAILIQAPASLQGAITRTLEVSADGTNFVTLANADGVVALPAAGQGFIFLDLLAARKWRIKYSGAPTLPEIWKVSKNWEP